MGPPLQIKVRRKVALYDVESGFLHLCLLHKGTTLNVKVPRHQAPHLAVGACSKRRHNNGAAHAKVRRVRKTPSRRYAG
jgi:hypothetical protein